LEAAVAAKQRMRMQTALELAQGIACGTNGGDPWRNWQERMIERIKQLR
jgi:hypothetical protein